MMDTDTKEKLYIAGVILLAILIIAGMIIFIYKEAKLEKAARVEKYLRIWDSCDYFIVMSNSLPTNTLDCYDSYIYLRVKSDGREGMFCFISPESSREKGTILGYCNSKDLDGGKL